MCRDRSHGPPAGESRAPGGAAADPHGWETGSGRPLRQAGGHIALTGTERQLLFWGVTPSTQRRSDREQSGKDDACANLCSLRKKRKSQFPCQ